MYQMRLFFGLITFITLATLISACSESITPTEPRSTTDLVEDHEPDSSPVASHDLAPSGSTTQLGYSGDCSILIAGIPAIRGDRIVVTGTCRLLDSACILTQLSANGEPVAWWPTDTCATIENGDWNIQVPLAQGNLVSRGYELQAWERGTQIAPAIYPFSVELGGENEQSIQIVPPSLPEQYLPLVGGSVSGLLNNDLVTFHVYRESGKEILEGTRRNNGSWVFAIPYQSLEIEHYAITAEAEGYSSQPSDYTFAADCRTTYIVRDNEIGEEALHLCFEFIPNDF